MDDRLNYIFELLLMKTTKEQDMKIYLANCVNLLNYERHQNSILKGHYLTLVHPVALNSNQRLKSSHQHSNIKERPNSNVLKIANLSLFANYSITRSLKFHTHTHTQKREFVVLKFDMDFSLLLKMVAPQKIQYVATNSQWRVWSTPSKIFELILRSLLSI